MKTTELSTIVFLILACRARGHSKERTWIKPELQNDIIDSRDRHEAGINAVTYRQPLLRRRNLLLSDETEGAAYGIETVLSAGVRGSLVEEFRKKRAHHDANEGHGNDTDGVGDGDGDGGAAGSEVDAESETEIPTEWPTEPPVDEKSAASIGETTDGADDMGDEDGEESISEGKIFDPEITPSPPSTKKGKKEKTGTKLASVAELFEKMHDGKSSTLQTSRLSSVEMETRAKDMKHQLEMVERGTLELKPKTIERYKKFIERYEELNGESDAVGAGVRDNGVATFSKGEDNDENKKKAIRPSHLEEFKANEATRDVVMGKTSVERDNAADKLRIEIADHEAGLNVMEEREYLGKKKALDRYDRRQAKKKGVSVSSGIKAESGSDDVGIHIGNASDGHIKSPTADEGESDSTSGNPKKKKKGDASHSFVSLKEQAALKRNEFMTVEEELEGSKTEKQKTESETPFVVLDAKDSFSKPASKIDDYDADFSTDEESKFMEEEEESPTQSYDGDSTDEESKFMDGENEKDRMSEDSEGEETLLPEYKDEGLMLMDGLNNGEDEDQLKISVEDMPDGDISELAMMDGLSAESGLEVVSDGKSSISDAGSDDDVDAELLAEMESSVFKGNNVDSGGADAGAESSHETNSVSQTGDDDDDDFVRPNDKSEAVMSVNEKKAYARREYANKEIDSAPFESVSPLDEAEGTILSEHEKEAYARREYANKEIAAFADASPADEFEETGTPATRMETEADKNEIEKLTDEPVEEMDRI